MITESHETVQAQLSVKQLNAIALLIRGYSDRRVAEAIGVARETVNVWRNHNQTFKAALEQARQQLWPTERDAIKERIGKVLATPLLSLAGIKARLELKDSLILQDLSDYNEKRARLIQRLEAEIDQARHYLDSLSKEDSITEQVALEANEYRTRLLTTLFTILTERVAPTLKEAILTQLAEQMDAPLCPQSP